MSLSKKKFLVLFLMASLLTAQPPHLLSDNHYLVPNKLDTRTVEHHLQATYKSIITRNVPIKIIFVNFDKNLVNLTYIGNMLQRYTTTNLNYGTAKYIFRYTLEHANTTINNAILNYIDRNKKIDNTSDLLEKVLEEQVNLVENGTLGVRRKIFVNNITGYSVDAVKFEQFLSSISDTEESFYIYMLNLSYLDDHNTGREHWFTVNEKNIDSNRTRDFWRLEWDNDLNKNVKFPYSGFNSKTRVLFIDPTSYNWYLTWTRIWWGGIYNSSMNGRYYEDLDHFIEKLNLEDPNDIADLNIYLVGWINDIMDDLIGHALSIDLAGGDLYAKTASAQIKVVNLRPDIVPTEDLKWTVHPSYIKEAFKEVYPNMELDIQVEFHDIADYPEIEAILNDNILFVNKSSGWTYYDGANIYYILMSSSTSYFDYSRADRVLTGWIFILYNGSMVVYNREFTGLGGGGKIMIMMDIHRIMGDKLDAPKQGFTSIIIHELGHAVGARHAFTSGSYGSDFAFDVMGYYPASWNFSTIRVNTMLREIGDFRILKYYTTMFDLTSNLNTTKYSSTVENLINQIYDGLTEADNLMNLTKYREANQKLDDIKNKIDLLESILTDKEPPTVQIIKPVNGSVANTTNITLIVAVSDNTIVDKIDVYVNDNKVYSGNETTIPIVISNDTINVIRVVAYDAAGNTASDEVVIYYQKSNIPGGGETSSLIWLITIVMIVGVIVIVLSAIFVLRVKR